MSAAYDHEANINTFIALVVLSEAAYWARSIWYIL